MSQPNYCPRLIEIALPIREISAESVRDKSLRHGHISTLHLWWARRPLPASRAIVFASLVYDPDHPDCPQKFRETVKKLLKDEVPSELISYKRGKENHIDKDPYKPYEELPDTLRNRLLAFIAKWSSEMLDFEKGKTTKSPKPEFYLDNRSLIKWETSDPNNQQGIAILRVAEELILAAYPDAPPNVLDPFAGGGSIPLEASRLGCQAIANDYNPVAYLILKASCEFPQKYGKPGKRKGIVEEFEKQIEKNIEVPNVLVHDLEKWANWILEKAKAKIGHLYQEGKDKRPIIGYFWARTAPCSNPSCKAEIPLLKSLFLCNKKDKTVALKMNIDNATKNIEFEIVKRKNIYQTQGTMQNRGNVLCPYCKQITPVEDLRTAGLQGKLGEKLIAVIVEDKEGKDYRIVEEKDIQIFQKINLLDIESPPELIVPDNTRDFRTQLYGYATYGSLFNHRQLLAMQTFIKYLHSALEQMKEEVEDKEYYKALGLYLGLWISRIAQRSSNVGIWDTTRETFAHPFGRQAIPMTWDYPEANPLSNSTGSAIGQLDWIIRFLNHESVSKRPAKIHYGDSFAFSDLPSSIDAVITDPPYFDAIAYSDLSDYFYVWLKRSLLTTIPEAFLTPLTPKTEEATSLKHRHNGDLTKAEQHFRKKLAQIFSKSYQLLKKDGIISIMFAHQSNKAWEALVHAIFDAGLTISATWAIDSELTTALKANKSVLSSSVTVTCRPRIQGKTSSFKMVRKEIEQEVKEAVKRFWSYGFRGADLVVACYGPAVGVFGKFERVEKGDGTPVEVAELLELARKSAQDAIAGEFKGDSISSLYYVWLNLYGASEQAWDDVRLVAQVGGSTEDATELAKNHDLFVIDGSKCRLALFKDRFSKNGLGNPLEAPLIDCLHRAMRLWKDEKRGMLVKYLAERGLIQDGPFWKLAQSLFEVLPHDTEDWKLVSALLGERTALRHEGKKLTKLEPQQELFD